MAYLFRSDNCLFVCLFLFVCVWSAYSNGQFLHKVKLCIIQTLRLVPAQALSLTHLPGLLSPALVRLVGVTPSQQLGQHLHTRLGSKCSKRKLASRYSSLSPHPTTRPTWGGVAEWLRHWTGDREVAGSSTGSTEQQHSLRPPPPPPSLFPLLSLRVVDPASSPSDETKPRGPAVCYRSVYVKEPTAKKNVVLAKSCTNSTKVRNETKPAGWRDSVAAGFPRGKRPEFPTDKFSWDNKVYEIQKYT